MKDLITILEEVRLNTMDCLEANDLQQGLDNDEIEAIVAVNMTKLAEIAFGESQNVASFSAFAGTLYSNIKDIQKAREIYDRQFKTKRIPIKQL